MAERLVYHWKHGWIPLSHAAALSKAHGNRKLADKYVPGAGRHGLNPHGITGDISRGDLRRAHTIDAHHSRGGKVALLDQRTGETVHMSEHHAASLHDQGHTVNTVTGGQVHTRDDYGNAHVLDPRTGQQNEHATSLMRQQDARNNASAVARTRPNPSSADISEAAAQWKADHPGQKPAGHEREIMQLANEKWAAKRLHGANTGVTASQAAAETNRIRRATAASGHMRQMRAIGL